MKLNTKNISSQGVRLKQGRSLTLILVSIACVITVFCLVATKTLLSEAGHQRRVLTSKKAAITQLQANISSVNALSNQMQALNSQATNIIGGTSTGTGPDDGSNIQIVLDALPNQYDFPGLTASVEKLLLARGVKVDSISGIDKESSNVPNAVPTPQPLPISFSFAATSTYTITKKIFADFQNSIRPFHVVSLQMSGTDSRMSINATVNAYFQPSKSVSITSTEVK